MKENAIDIQTLDTIFNSMVRTMDQSKNDIFIISEQSRQSFEDMQKELASSKRGYFPGNNRRRLLGRDDPAVT